MECLTLHLRDTDEICPCNDEERVRAPAQCRPIEICTWAAPWAVDVSDALVRGTVVYFNTKVIRPGDERPSPLNGMDSTFSFMNDVFLVAQPAFGI